MAACPRRSARARANLRLEVEDYLPSAYRDVHAYLDPFRRAQNGEPPLQKPETLSSEGRSSRLKRLATKNEPDCGAADGGPCPVHPERFPRSRPVTLCKRPNVASMACCSWAIVMVLGQAGVGGAPGNNAEGETPRVRRLSQAA